MYLFTSNKTRLLTLVIKMKTSRMTTVSSSKELKCTLLGLGLENEARLELEKARESLSLTILIKRN